MLNFIGNSITNAGNAALSLSGEMLNAGVQKAKDLTINGLVNTGKYITGYSNLENAWTTLRSTEERKIVLAKTNHADKNGESRKDLKEYKVSTYKPSILDNFKEAVSSEALPLAVKMVYMHGAVNKMGAAVGLTEGGGVTALIFNGTLHVVNYVAIPVGSFVGSNVVTPVVKELGDLVYHNVVTSTAMVATLGIFYSAMNDLDALREDNFGVNKDSAPGYVDTALHVGSAFAKGLAGVGVIAATIAYHSET